MTDPAHEVRPWGEFWVLAGGAGFKVKRLDVDAGKRLSYQRHEKRREHWIVVAGRARITLDGAEFERRVGETFDVPMGGAHRIENLGPERLSIIEVQIGKYLGEDDIQRLADDFGRA